MSGETAQTSRALWYAALRSAELRNEPVRLPAADEVLVRALYGAISRGTERLIFNGRVPASEYARMRGPGMQGAFPFPVKYGYATVGRVEQGPTDLAGKLVFALHPHQSLFTIKADAAVVLPEGVPARRAVLAANMETALNAIWDASPAPADRIAVVGAGTVGALSAWLCGRLPGARVTLIDVLPDRRAVATALGVAFALPDTAPRDCDLVIHASASAAGLATAIALAGDEATVLELSWYGEGDITVPLGGAFHSRRLRLAASQVGEVAVSHRARWSHRRRLGAALDLLTDPALDALLAPPIALADLPASLPHIFDAESVLCQLVRYPGAKVD